MKHIKPLARSESLGLEHVCKHQAEYGTIFETGFLASGNHAKRAPSLRPVIGPESVQRSFTGKTGFRGSTPPNGAGTHRARSCTAPRGKFGARQPLRKVPTQHPLTRNYAAKCPPPASGRAPLRGVGLAAWPSRWVTGGPDLLRRLGNRRTWRRAAPRCEFRARHPLRQTPLGQNQAGSHALN